MTRFTEIKLGLAVIGLLVWGYGYRVDDQFIGWIGIAFLAAAVIVRFLPRRLRGNDYRPPEK